MNLDLATRINALLPQTQCTRCGYPSCRLYAEAVANGAADIDQCPPGGAAGVDALADLLVRASKPLNPAFGIEARASVAVIDEEVCIGCTKCIEACPVDAIIGAAKRMHTIIDSQCTGCELCIPPCPVDCITMVETSIDMLSRSAVLARAAQARTRYETRNQRLIRERLELDLRRSETQRMASIKAPLISKSAVLEAIARGKARRKTGSDGPTST